MNAISAVCCSLAANDLALPSTSGAAEASDRAHLASRTGHWCCRSPWSSGGPATFRRAIRHTTRKGASVSAIRASHRAGDSPSELSSAKGGARSSARCVGSTAIHSVAPLNIGGGTRRASSCGSVAGSSAIITRATSPRTRARCCAGCKEVLIHP